MKLLIKSLSILAVAGIFAGTAFAGPGDAYLGFSAARVAKASTEKKPEYVTIALFSTRSDTCWSERQVQVKACERG